MLCAMLGSCSFLWFLCVSYFIMQPIYYTLILPADHFHDFCFLQPGLQAEKKVYE